MRPKNASTFRIRNGVREALYGGYVSWDGKKMTDFGYPVRHSREVRIWLPASLNYDGCGRDTNYICRKLCEKLIRRRRFKTERHVECREMWRY